MLKLVQKIAAQASLMTRRPEEVLRNLRQFTSPQAFLASMTDLPGTDPIAAVAAPGPPTLNILLPAIQPRGMTGGPNTVLTIGGRLALAGIRVRFVACSGTLNGGMGWFWSHLAQLTGQPERPPLASVCDVASAPLRIGPDDLVMASFWTTAHQAAALLAHTRARRFLYLIQDFEPAFYPWSSRYAQALATYSLPFHAIVNEATLADFLAANAHGHFADPAFRASCTVFEPALDRSVFRPAEPTPGPGAGSDRPRRLLVYARPSNPRNLLEIAVAALRRAVADGVIPASWEVLAIGARGSLPPVPLGGGRVMREAPWRDYAGYAELLRGSDILLCPMLSPHTSYPVLEMAASGGLAVTNHFGTKSAARLAALSPNILPVAPSLDGFVAGIAASLRKVQAGYDRTAPVTLPATWDESLVGVRDLVLRLLGGASPECDPSG